jgi:hypothetical protein
LVSNPAKADAAYMDKLIDEPTYAKIKTISEKCETLLQEEKWTEANSICNEIIIEILKSAGLLNKASGTKQKVISIR